MYNKFTENDTIKNTGTGSIKFPVSSNIELWYNDEKRSYENLSRPIRNLFENSMETQFILDKIQSGLKMTDTSILNGCELVVSTIGADNYVTLTSGLFYSNDIPYTIYPTPSIASRQLERDLGIITDDGIDHITITYENGKFKADINITKNYTAYSDITAEYDRGIDLLGNIKSRLTSFSADFSPLEDYALEPCFKLTVSTTQYVNFNNSNTKISLETTVGDLSFGSVTSYAPTNNTSAVWSGLVESAYKDNSVNNAKLANMDINTLKGNNLTAGDPKDLSKEDVVTMFNLVTRDIAQTIDETKTFTVGQTISNTKKLKFAPNWNISSNDSNAFIIDESGTSRISIASNNGAMTIANPVSLSETLGVTGVTTLNNSLTVNASETGEKIDLNGPITVVGDTTIAGKLTVTATTADKSINLLGPTNITGKVIITSKETDESVFVEGNTRIKSLDDGTIELETPTLSTTSKTFVIGSGSTKNTATNGSGIVFKSNVDKTFLWENGTPEATNSSFTSSENLNLKINKTYKINNTDVLSNTTLGTEVINSSLEVVGTITGGTWNGTPITVDNGGTGATSYTKGQLLIGDTNGDTLTKGFITGTDNRIIVTNGDGTITLNAPQDIHTEASPTFKELTLTGNLAVNGSAITTTETTEFSILNTNLTGVLNFANVATTINMGELANINIGKTTSENKTFKILNTTTSTNSTTGALVVSGGVGIGGNVFTDGNLTTAGKITSAGLQSAVTDTSLEVATNGVNTTGNVKSIISSDKKFSIEKGGTDGNLLSVKHSGITVGVPIDSSKAITSTDIIKAYKFETTSINTVSAINSKEFNSNTIKNTVESITGSNVSLLWTNSNETEIKRTHFINFPVAVLNGSNGLMPASALSSIKQLQEAAGFVEGEGYSNSLLRVVNTKSSIEGDITLYSNDLKLSETSTTHTDGVDEATKTIYDMFRDLRTEKVRVKGHLPAEAVITSPFGQIIKKTSGTTAVAWGQITDDEISTTLTKVSPSNSDNLTDDFDREIAFWSTDKKSLIHDTDITYNTSTNTLIAETVSSRSSRKLKKDIELYEKSAFDTIDKIDIVSYHFIADETQTDRVGFIAEDSPELVSGKDRDHMEMNNCIGLLLKAVQELKQENAELRSLINDKNS